MNRWGMCERVSRTRTVGAADGCRDRSSETQKPMEGDLRSRMDRLLQCLKEVPDESENCREEVVSVDGSRAVTGVVEKDVLSRTLILHLRERQRARSPIAQEKEVLGRLK